MMDVVKDPKVADDDTIVISVNDPNNDNSCRDHNNNPIQFSETEDVSDVSVSDSESILPDAPIGIYDSLSEAGRFNIAFTQTNASSLNYVQSRHRENVDRLLMSSMASREDGEIEGERRAVVGRPRVGYSGCMQHRVPAPFVHTYDQNYYKADDWLRFVPRRNSQHSDHLESGSSGLECTDSARGPHIGLPPSPNPDSYYRGFDNTRIRMKFDSLHEQSTVRRHFNHYGQESRNVEEAMHEQVIDAPHIKLRPESPSLTAIHPNVNSGMVDECQDATKKIGFHDVSMETVDSELSNAVNAKLSAQSNIVSDVDGKCNKQQESNVTLTQPRPKLQYYQSSLRKGSIVRPVSTSEENNNIHANISDNMRDMQMHMAHWDSKYETYSCRVDQSQEDRAVEIPIVSMARPHMRAFHYAWISFFLVFLAWFAITPLLPEVQKSLNLSKEQIWTSSICSMAGGLIARCLMGVLCDLYGARLMTAMVLVICGIPTCFTGLVNTSIGLSALRFVIGIGGSAFVTCQYWTSSMFTREVSGTANAIAAGWGNLGGGVTQILVGSILFPFLKWIYSSSGTKVDPSELAWRTSCIIPGLLCLVFTYTVVRNSDDCPKGNYHKRKRLGLMQKVYGMSHFKAALMDLNTWILMIQYGCCFGVELTTTNAATLYFKEEFELSTVSASAIASLFGLMNLFARGLGGFLSDVSNAYKGMRGRLIWQLSSFALEGIFIIIFSKANTLLGAVVALITFSLFVQASEGSTFGIVPYLNPNLTGAVAGIIGAGGNAGGIVFAIFFRCMPYRTAFFYMGAITTCASFLSFFLRVKGYKGLLSQNATHQPNALSNGGN